MSDYKVYISSTYRDLVTYRDKVRETLDKVPNFKVVGMENYTAGNIAPLDQCLKDVDACQIYILILGNRYGYVIPEEGKSVTHLEYLQAKKSGKIILAFKSENRDGRFIADMDEDQLAPPASEKKEKLAALKKEVGESLLMHPEGFTSEYHLALQVMESLVRNPRVDFDGVLPEDRKIFCDRAIQVYDFYDVVREKSAFNVFLIQGQRNNLGRSLVERLCKYYLGIQDATMLSYHEFIQDPSIDNFKRRLINELCEKLLPNESDPPSDVRGLLSVLSSNGVSTLPFISVVSNNVQWDSGYRFLDAIFNDFDTISKELKTIKVFWFLVIDSPEQLVQTIQSVPVHCAPKLSMLQGSDIEKWLTNYVVNDDEKVLSLQELCFPESLDGSEFSMKQAQEQIRMFINRYNARRKENDRELIKILP